MEWNPWISLWRINELLVVSFSKKNDVWKKEMKSYCLNVKSYERLSGVGRVIWVVFYVNRKLRYVTKMSLVKIVTIEFEAIMIMTPCPWVPKDKWMGCFPTIVRKLTPSITSSLFPFFNCFVKHRLFSFTLKSRGPRGKTSEQQWSR